MKTLKIVLGIFGGVAVLAAAAVYVGTADARHTIKLREQVFEASWSDAVSAARLEVTMSWVGGHEMPKDIKALGSLADSFPTHDYANGIKKLEIEHGSVVITMGGGAVDEALQGKKLVLMPCVNSQEVSDVRWQCTRRCPAGFGFPGEKEASLPRSTVPPELLSTTCR